MNETIEYIDKLARQFPDKVNLTALRRKLMNSCPDSLLKVDKTPSILWIKMVNKYIKELGRVQEWNKISKQM